MFVCAFLLLGGYEAKLFKDLFENPKRSGGTKTSNISHIKMRVLLKFDNVESGGKQNPSIAVKYCLCDQWEFNGPIKVFDINALFLIYCSLFNTTIKCPFKHVTFI